jgi:hypothetical protein
MQKWKQVSTWKTSCSIEFCVVFKRFLKHDVHCVQFEVNGEQLAARDHCNCGRPQLCSVDSPIAKWGSKLATKAAGQRVNPTTHVCIAKEAYPYPRSSTKSLSSNLSVLQKNRTFPRRPMRFRNRRNKTECALYLSAYRSYPGRHVHFWSS